MRLIADKNAEFSALNGFGLDVIEIIDPSKES
jgi:hypothetical protein